MVVSVVEPILAERRSPICLLPWRLGGTTGTRMLPGALARPDSCSMASPGKTHMHQIGEKPHPMHLNAGLTL